jgi:hypothetical protein
VKTTKGKGGKDGLLPTSHLDVAPPLPDPWAPMRASEPYRVLREGLQNAFRDFVGNETPLLGAMQAVAAAYDFLRTDHEIAAAGHATPLVNLAFALIDHLARAKHPLLDLPKRGGRPYRPSRDALKAVVVHALDVLIQERSLGRNDAGKIVARELQQSGRKHSAKTILGWRDEVRAGGAPLAAALREKFAAARRVEAPAHATIEAEVQALLTRLLHWGL